MACQRCLPPEIRWNTSIKQICKRERNKKQAPTYLDEYFNTKVFYQASSEGESVMARVLNALTSAINQKDARLPKYLILLLDRNLINHVNVQDNFEEAAMTAPDCYYCLFKLGLLNNTCWG